MKQLLLFLLVFSSIFPLSVFSQDAEIQLDSKIENEILLSNFEQLKVTFSFKKIESYNIKKEEQNFSIISFENSYPNGKIGCPQLPQSKKLIVIPTGATVKVSINNYTTTEYDLSEYSINKIFPYQSDVRKDQNPADIRFEYNENVYSKDSFSDTPLAEVEELGTMRGLRLGVLKINPVSYNPVSGKILVYNSISIEINFENPNIALSRQLYKTTNNRYFASLYSQPLNANIFGKQTKDAFDIHTDFYHTPVRMLVVANDMFEEHLQPWLLWKTQKGFYIDVHYTTETGSNFSSIQSFIQNKYQQSVMYGNAYTFLVLVGDIAQIPAQNGTNNDNVPTDLWYASVDGDMFPEMYHSRISVETNEELDNFIEKLLYYEKYEIADPSYLNDVLLIAGEDSYFNFHEAQPTLHYAETYYFNNEHGFNNVYAYYDTPYTGCYNRFNDGVGFANYTAHGGSNCWAGPYFGTTDVYNLTNINKYFWALGNCCQSGAFQSGLCLGEAIIRANKKGGFAYIGSVPNTFWGADFYWTVGYLTNGYISDQTTFTPTFDETNRGMYQYFFNKEEYNTISSLMFVGNLTVSISNGAGTGRRYFEGYHTFGDGSVMPFITQPAENEINYNQYTFLGTTSYELTAEPNSYAAISKDGVLLGVGYTDNSGNCSIQFSNPLNELGEYLLVVTCPQKVPFIQTIETIITNGEFVTKTEHYLDGDGILSYNETTNLSVKIKNVGTQNSTNLTLTLSCNDNLISITNPVVQHNPLAIDEEVLLENIYELVVFPNIENGHVFHFTLTIQSETNEWLYFINIPVSKPILNYIGHTTVGDIVENQDFIINVTVKNNGNITANNTIGYLSCENSNVTIENSEFNIGNIGTNETKNVIFLVKFNTATQSEDYEFHFEAIADNGLISTDADFVVNNQNKCQIMLTLQDSWGDGWVGYGHIGLIVGSSVDTTEYILQGGSAQQIVLEIYKYSEVTLMWNVAQNANYTSEVSYSVAYSDGTIINTSQNPTNGQSFSFVNTCNCDISECNLQISISIVEVQINNNEAVVNLSFLNNQPENTIAYQLTRDSEIIALLPADCVSYSDVVFDFNTNQNYTYSLTAICNSGYYSNNVSTNVYFVAENIINIAEINIFPNPTERNNLVKIVSDEIPMYIQIIDINGKIIKEYNNTSHFNAPNISGSYFVKMLFCSGNIKFEKIIVF